MTIFLLLILPGLTVLYGLVLRPMMHQIPALQKFYAEADGFWAKVWAMCGRSVTLLWGYILGGMGWGLELIEPISQALGDPDLKTQVTTALQGNPKILGWVTIAISAITIIARLRSIGKQA